MLVCVKFLSQVSKIHKCLFSVNSFIFKDVKQKLSSSNMLALQNLVQRQTSFQLRSLLCQLWSSNLAINIIYSFIRKIVKYS